MNPCSTPRPFPSISELPLSESDAKRFPVYQPTLPFPKPAGIRRSWTPEEDEVLLRAVSGQSTIAWDTVASRVGSHTMKQCRERYLVKLNPDVRRSPFEKWEDDIIRGERQRIGNHWSVIAQLLPGRTACSVKNRWYTVLRFELLPLPMCLRANSLVMIRAHGQNM
jgi:hypothetical protein